MQSFIHVARVIFLRRAPKSSVSLLIPLDVGPEPHPELDEQLQDLLHEVYLEEARARQDARYG